MLTPAEAARTVSSCFLCGDTRIAAVGCVLPVNDDLFDALMRLREQPISDGETPVLWFGLCGAHAQHVHSAARVKAKILAAAEQVVAH